MSKKVEKRRRNTIVTQFEKRLRNVGYTLCKRMTGEQCDNAEDECPHQYVKRGIWLHWLGNKGGKN